MSATLAFYRGATGVVGALAVPIGSAIATADSPWRGRWGRASGVELAAGGPWIHAASMGEAGAARSWGEALVASGYRAPFLVTTRTATGLARVQREFGPRAVAAIAPIDFPQAVRRVLATAAPLRLDVMETELWPNLLVEAHRARVPVVVVSATVSARTASRLRSLGLAGSRLFRHLHVLAQSERHAERFRTLGVSARRCVVIGDVKADAVPPPAGNRSAGARRLVLFASARPGEEGAAVAVASALTARGGTGTPFVVAPRHAHAATAFRAALERAGFRVRVRDDALRDTESLIAWASREADGPSVGLLATVGELPELYLHARIAVVGGTFAAYGGHNVLEPAASGCPVLVGPHHEEVEPGVSLLVAHGGGAVVPDLAALAATLTAWLESGDDERRVGALAAAAAARGATRRGLDALATWDLSL